MYRNIKVEETRESIGDTDIIRFSTGWRWEIKNIYKDGKKYSDREYRYDDKNIMFQEYKYSYILNEKEEEKHIYGIGYHHNTSNNTSNISSEKYLIEHNKKEVYHRIDGPAFIHYDENGIKNMEVWRIYGKIHREDGPAQTNYYQDGSIQKEEYFKEGLLHREKTSLLEDGPAVISYYQDGIIEEERYYIKNLFHREGDKPAVVSYYRDGKISEEEYFYKGKRHRENNKPSVIDYNIYGEVYSEMYHINGEWHNEQGPAYIYQHDLKLRFSFMVYNPDDKLKNVTEYYIFDNLISKNRYNSLIYVLKKAARKFKRRKRIETSRIVYDSTLLCRDICNVIASYVY